MKIRIIYIQVLKIVTIILKMPTKIAQVQTKTKYHQKKNN
jgi:hypothetical protein